jgi:hypothetical protein
MPNLDPSLAGWPETGGGKVVRTTGRTVVQRKPQPPAKVTVENTSETPRPHAEGFEDGRPYSHETKAAKSCVTGAEPTPSVGGKGTPIVLQARRR